MISLHITSYPSTSSFNLTNTLGFLLIMGFALQFVTGLLLVMYYSPTSSYNITFSVVISIGNDHNLGFIIRNFHIIMAGCLFIFLYLHWLRGLILYMIYSAHLLNLYHTSQWYDSYLAYVIGFLLVILFVVEGFVGYSLVAGNLSYWATIVILSIVTVIPVIGKSLFYLLFSSYLIALNRLFLLHFLIGFIIIGVIALHLFVLHMSVLSTPLIFPAVSYISFAAIIFKDFLVFLIFFSFLSLISFSHTFDVVADSTNNMPFDLINTPLHIIPEFYFLLFYAILRCIPIKFYGFYALIVFFILSSFTVHLILLLLSFLLYHFIDLIVFLISTLLIRVQQLFTFFYLTISWLLSILSWG